MSTNRKTSQQKSKSAGFERIEKLHPYKTFMFFGLVGSTILFLSMAFLYFITVSRTIQPVGFQLPKSFVVSTVLLLISSFTLSDVTNAFRNDSFKRMKLSLSVTLVLGLLFCVSQITGWLQMAEAGFFVQSNVGVAYLYVITGMHFIHVAGGIIYLSILTVNTFSHSSNVARSLLFLTDNYQLTRLQLITIFWHFVDVLWLLLFFMFLYSL